MLLWITASIPTIIPTLLAAWDGVVIAGNAGVEGELRPRDA
jgi:hypothetical protein